MRKKIFFALKLREFNQTSKHTAGHVIWKCNNSLRAKKFMNLQFQRQFFITHIWISLQFEINLACSRICGGLISNLNSKTYVDGLSFWKLHLAWFQKMKHVLASLCEGNQMWVPSKTWVYSNIENSQLIKSKWPKISHEGT